MTPFGARVRALRAEHGVTLKDMAAALRVSPAYLSALEHGHRGAPGPGLVHQVCEFFGLIWDEADALAHLARLSHPRIMVDTAGLSPEQTALANRLAQSIARLSPGDGSSPARRAGRPGPRPKAPPAPRGGQARVTLPGKAGASPYVSPLGPPATRRSGVQGVKPPGLA